MVVIKKHYGVKNIAKEEKVDDTTLFQAASISKPLVAMATLNLVENGNLSLNGKANEYLTSWQIPEHKYSQKSPVLVEQLLNHSSSLSVHGFAGYKSGEPIPSLIEVLNGSTWSERLFNSKVVNSAPIEVEKYPGYKFSYSGGGYTVLQQLLIDVSKQNFSLLMQKNVLTPLNMSNSTYDQPLDKKSSQFTATGHPKKDTPLSGGHHVYPEQAAAGLWTTSQDLAKFVLELQHALLDDTGRVLTEKSAEKMTSGSVKNYVGLGLFLQGANRDKLTYFQHDGWNEGFSSSFIAHKYNGYGVVILTNANQPEFNNEVTKAIAKKYDWQNY